MSEKTKRFVARFTGRVQGVGFRMTCILQARDLQINGFVRNEHDGSVLLDIDATNADGNELIRRVRAEMQRNIVTCHVDEHDSQGRSDGFGIQN